jgi:hypothetical protein
MHDSPDMLHGILTGRPERKGIGMELIVYRNM